MDEANNAGLIGAAGHETRALAELRKAGYDCHILVQSLNFPTTQITNDVLTNTIEHYWFYNANDAVARVAVQAENRDRLYERGRSLLQQNRQIFSEWLAELGEGFSYVPPQAGAIAFVQYSSPTPSLELVERIRENQSTLIVPGIHLGLEGYVRIWLGGKQGYLEEGLRRVAVEMSAL